MEDNFAYDASFFEELVCLAGFGEGELSGDEGLELLLMEETEEGFEVVAEEFGAEAFEGLDAVGEDATAAGEERPACDVEAEQEGSAEALSAAGTA